jgi:hypothetical protein
MHFGVLFGTSVSNETLRGRLHARGLSIVTHGEFLDKPPEGCRLCMDAVQSWVLASQRAGPNGQHDLKPRPGARIQLWTCCGQGPVLFFEGKLIMLQMMMMGGRVFETSSFKQAMDSNYYPLDSMKQSVEILKNSENIDIETMEFGQYQPILAASAVNQKGAKFWLQNMGRARVQLTAQPNDAPVSDDDPTVPLTKCARLDACVRKCFNSDPPICMTVNVTQKSKDDPDPTLHDILLEWDYAAGSTVPTLLNLTMVCPASY